MKPIAAAPAHRILLVDDNLFGLIARKTILIENGYRVETASNAEAALDLIQNNQFDVVVADYRLSGMDGIELIRRIRASDSPARTVILSGFSRLLGLTEQSTGADEVILKSENEVPELLRAVGKLVSRPRRRSEQRSPVAKTATAD